MQQILEIIRGEVSQDLIQKADRLFLNSDASVWTELLQNSRRAGATCVEIQIDEQPEKQCLVTIRDNGKGVSDFRKLVMLGKSGWDQETEKKEDPAGMGLFALCRSEVEVHSGNRRAKIIPACFRGESVALVETTDDYVHGTQVRFTRASTKAALKSALHEVTEFCPVDVRLEGTPLVRHDFLEGALYREVIDGIEIGLSTHFRWSYSCIDHNWNFYGSRIRGDSEEIEGLLGYSGDGAPGKLVARFNVLETSRVKLQLPDRRGIIQDEFLAAFKRKARAAAYRFFKTQAQHALPYRNWLEAKQLGVDLPEAAFLLTTWHARPKDDSIPGLFGEPEHHLLDTVAEAVLAEDDFPSAHTLEAALETGATMEGKVYEINHAYRGYSWYDNLPVIEDATILIDGVDYETWKTTRAARPQTIEIELTIQQKHNADRIFRLPALIHVETDQWNWNECEIEAVVNSPWDNDVSGGPFSLTEFLSWAVFCYSGEGDTWETQKSSFDDDTEELLSAYFRSPKANLAELLAKALGYRIRSAAKELGICEIHFKLGGPEKADWSIEMIEASSAVEPPATGGSV
jgi:hypothetical protein